MIEKSEETLDYEQNRKMVIDIQKYAMSHFTGSMEVVTHFQLLILGPKVQNYELTLVPNAIRNEHVAQELEPTYPRLFEMAFALVPSPFAEGEG